MKSTTKRVKVTKTERGVTATAHPLAADLDKWLAAGWSKA